MNHLWNLIRKELRELITPSTLIPLVFVVIIFAALGPLMTGSISESDGPPRIGFLNADVNDVDEYATVASNAVKTYYGTDYSEYVVEFDRSIYGNNEAMTEAMRSNDLKTLLVIDPDFSTNISLNIRGAVLVYWYQTDLGGIIDMSEISMSGVISQIMETMTETLILELRADADAEFITSPVSYNLNSNYLILNNGVHQGYTPSQVSAALMTQNMFISIIMMLIIIMIGSILISSMGSEKENKTLETLLTLPVSRTTVVAGKLIGSAIVGLIFGAVYLVGMYLSMGTASQGSVDLNELGLALSAIDWAIVGTFLFMAIAAALGICMILGAFAKNYKAAQTLIMPVTVLAIVPMILTIMGSFNTLPAVLQAVMFAIPFSHPMMIMQNLMFDNNMLIITGFVYLVIFSLVTMYITVRLYRSDILLTGFIRKKSGGLKFLTKKK